jgi:hypothetical protein
MSYQENQGVERKDQKRFPEIIGMRSDGGIGG